MARDNTSTVAFTLNGNPTAVDLSAERELLTLSQWLRRTGRTGTKEGCAEGDCGACTVLVSDEDARGAPVFRAVNACIALLPSMAGREVVTVEGVGRGDPLHPTRDDALHPVQQAMICAGGSQCGYCTPGFVMSMVEGCLRADLPADPQHIPAQLDGNLCRCTGYRPIREAMLEALRARDGGALVGIGRAPKTAPEAPPLPALDVVDAGAHRYARPTTLHALLTLRARHPEARLVAGATEVGVELRKRHAELPLLIATEGIAELRRIEETADAWRVGGAATLSALDEVLARSARTAVVDGLRRMLRVFASRPIRNRATLAGNVVTASPIGDMAPALLALDAEVEMAALRDGTVALRRMPLAEFFLAYRKTALAADEVVTAVVIPRHAQSRFFVQKVSKRRDLDISIVAAAFRLDVDAQGVATAARLAFGGVAATPVRARRTEALLEGKAVPSSSLACPEIVASLGAELSPIDDVRAGKAYRSAVCASLWARFLDGDLPEDASLERDEPFVQRHRVEEPRVEEPRVEPRVEEPVASKALLHDSARGHVTGGARYVDDVAQQRPMLEVWPVVVPHAHAKIVRRDAVRARSMPGVVAVLFAEDIPGDNDVGAVRKDETLLAHDEVMFHGHPVALVVGESVAQCRRAAQAVEVEVEPLPAVLGIDAAVAAQSFHTEPHIIARGDAATAIARAPHRLTGELSIGGQEHFYLETHAAFAERGEDDEVQVWSSTQHPSEIQAVVSHVLHLPRHKVTVTSPRMGGGFGGKETQGNTWAALVALASWHTRRPVRVQLDRDVDMELTGKRHPFFARFRVGFDEQGIVRGLDVKLVSDGGWALDLSGAILDRALFHLDNAYFFPHIRVEGRVAKTHVVSHTAFRGFGGPQGMLVVEDVLSRVALSLGLPLEVVRARNFYAPSGSGTPQTTHYGQRVEDNRIPRMWSALTDSAELTRRREEIVAFNARSPEVKRGLAMTPVKFGISFTTSFLNQAGALVLIYRDGTVQVNHGGTEMGQGLHTKIVGVVMRELGVSAEQIRVMRTQTDKVPNTSATAASSGADLNGAAVRQACLELRWRLGPVAARLLSAQQGVSVVENQLQFSGGVVRGGGGQVGFAAVVEAAYLAQTNLSATGYYRTPDIHYDRAAGRGKPFHYFAFGVCAAEVELDGRTGMKRVRRVDILHDVGDSLNPQVDRGQVEGAFLQGLGWLTAEELKWDSRGRLLTHSASTYQIPTLWDAPPVFHVELLPDAAQHDVVHGSKAVGEPPFMLAIAVREALRDAVQAFGRGGAADLPSPLTHEALFHAVRRGREPG